MSRSRLVFLSFALGACSTASPSATTATSQPASQPTSQPAARPADQALLERCEADCAHRDQARAVAAEMIVTDCHNRCTALTTWPLVEAGPAARRNLDRHVRLQGVVGAVDVGSVELADGTLVRLDLAQVREVGLIPGARMVLAGRLDSDEAGFWLTVDHAAAVPPPAR